MPRLRLRLSLIDGPELRCPHCFEWFPVTPEFWRINKWDACLVCHRERARLYQLMRRRDEEVREQEKQYQRSYRAWLRSVAPDYVQAYERERAAKKRAAKAARRMTDGTTDQAHA